MSNTIGEKIRVTVFGQSHAPSIGAVIEGLPAGMKIDMERVRAFMARRAPGRDKLSTARKEADDPKIIAGLNEWGETCGSPLCMVIENSDQRSKDYSKLRDLPRPGHADYTAAVKFDGANDIRGGGQFSGRLTAPICFAGAVCIQLLEQKGIRIGAHIASIADTDDVLFDIPDDAILDLIQSHDFPVINEEAGERMRQRIMEAKAEGDSVGGIIEVCAINVPAGLGDPMFDGMENCLARAAFGIPAVRGVEFGTGFAAARMRGSQHNDPFYMRENGTVATKTNHHGGILGGITSGMPIVMRVAIKPTPSIAKEQQTVSLRNRENERLVIEGRHDPCIVHRAVPCLESIMAIAIADKMV